MQEPTYPTPVRIPRPEHTLSRSLISKGALHVLYQLRHAGYQAFLVGGGVRDVLLGRVPKDFDVVTNALPEQVKKVFLRQCRLIGKRFLLAHVRVNKEIIEVSTFRAHHDKGGDGVMEDGRIVRDNVYGTIDEDVWRRDFTINALYYDISNFSLIDYANGLADLRNQMIRLIGIPQLRYREDPVRMLRAVRFAAKLNFAIAPETAEPITQCGDLLAHIPPARLYEEVLKLFFTGHAQASFAQLRHYNLFKYLFPYTENCFDEPKALVLIEQALKNTDSRLAEHKSIASAFLLAILLWPPIERLVPRKAAKGQNMQQLLLESSQHILIQQMHYVFIPKRLTTLMQEIWLLQHRLTRRSRSKKSLAIMSHPRFRAAYDFLVLRAQADDSLTQYAQWWQQLVNSDDASRQTLLAQHPYYFQRPRRYRKSKKKTSTETSS